MNFDIEKKVLTRFNSNYVLLVEEKVWIDFDKDTSVKAFLLFLMI